MMFQHVPIPGTHLEKSWYCQTSKQYLRRHATTCDDMRRLVYRQGKIYLQHFETCKGQNKTIKVHKKWKSQKRRQLQSISKVVATSQNSPQPSQILTGHQNISNIIRNIFSTSQILQRRRKILKQASNLIINLVNT